MADRSPFSDGASTSGGGRYIEHTVSKLDTLAGVAIKYGVEVADIKRLNGLTTDLQMFALKTLRIPPGRHLPSSALTSVGRSRCETSAPHNFGLRRVSSQESNLNHEGPEGTQRSSAMELLRGHYGLLLSRTEREGTELAMFASDSDITEDEPFSPMSPISDAADFRRLSTLDFRTSRFDPTRETSSSLLDSSWLISGPLPPTAASTKFSINPLSVGDKLEEIKLVTEADLPTKDLRPIRRRARGDFGSDEMPDIVSETRVSLPEKNRGKNSSVKTIGAALLGGKGAVEGLISKVLHSGSSSTTVQEVGKPPTGSLPVSTGTSSVVEGITQVYRRGKAAVD